MLPISFNNSLCAYLSLFLFSTNKDISLHLMENAVALCRRLFHGEKMALRDVFCVNTHTHIAHIEENISVHIPKVERSEIAIK